jgi:hypothetical protein
LHEPNASPARKLTLQIDPALGAAPSPDGALGAEPEETIMLRKLSLVAVAAASLGLAALAPTSASAFGAHGFHGGGGHGGWHGGWHGGPRFFVGGPGYYGSGYGYGGCTVRRLVPTPWGPRWRLVNRCY